MHIDEKDFGKSYLLFHKKLIGKKHT